jgi:hypothetical protein
MSDGPAGGPGYELAPSPVARRSSRSAVLVAGLAGLILGGAVVAAIAGGLSGPRPAPIAEATTRAAHAAASPGPSAVADDASPTHPAIVLPLWVTCHDLAAERCRSLAAAAVAGIDDPALTAPSSVEVWGSILCGSTFDCPPTHLDGHHSAGSVVVAFPGTVTLWVNVTEADRGLGGGPGVRPLEVWVIPSQTAG